MGLDASSEYAIGWGTLCLINAGLAQAKGHSRLVWALLSLFLGPIATLLLVVFMDVKGPKGQGTV